MVKTIQLFCLVSDGELDFNICCLASKALWLLWIESRGSDGCTDGSVADTYNTYSTGSK